MTVEEREKQIRDAIVDELRRRVATYYERPEGFAGVAREVPQGLHLACTIDVLVRRHAQAEQDTQVMLETLQHQLVKRIEELEKRLADQGNLPRVW